MLQKLQTLMEMFSPKRSLRNKCGQQLNTSKFLNIKWAQNYSAPIFVF